MNFTEKTEQIIKEFSVFDDWMDKYHHLIEWGKKCPLLEEKDKTETFLIKACQSRLWLKPEFVDGKIYFKADSDALITKGMAALLIFVFSAEEPQTIQEASTDFIDQIGLREHLSPTRSNGLNSMIKQIKLYALAFSIKR